MKRVTRGVVMRLLIWLVPFVACFDAWPAVAGQDTAESPPKMARYFVGLIYRGPGEAGTLIRGK